jgi:hypothetical protein
MGVKGKLGNFGKKRKNEITRRLLQSRKRFCRLARRGSEEVPVCSEKEKGVRRQPAR